MRARERRAARIRPRDQSDRRDAKQRPARAAARWRQSQSTAEKASARAKERERDERRNRLNDNKIFRATKNKNILSRKKYRKRNNSIPIIKTSENKNMQTNKSIQRHKDMASYFSQYCATSSKKSDDLISTTHPRTPPFESSPSISVSICATTRELDDDEPVPRAKHHESCTKCQMSKQLDKNK